MMKGATATTFAFYICIFQLIICFALIESLGVYRAEIPNGFNVPCPPGACVGICKGVGHKNEDGSPGCGGGEHPFHSNNQFGNDLEKFGNYTWTETVCLSDSDGDGLTNGDELGDPCCEWSKKNSIPMRTGKHVSHPGFASSKISERSCSKDGAPTATILNSTVSTNSLTVQLDTNNSCICRFIWNVQKTNNASNPYLTITHILGNTSTNIYTISGLDPDTDYTLQLIVRNLAGNVTINHNFTTDALDLKAPNPPTMISQSSVTSSSLLIVWTGATINNNTLNDTTTPSIIGYELDTKEDGETFFYRVYSGNASYYQATGLKPDTIYLFRVRSIDNMYGISRNSYEQYFSTLVEAPTNGTNNNTGPTVYTLNFKADSAVVAGQLAPFSISIQSSKLGTIAWNTLADNHGRKMHVYFIGSDFDIFTHLHPEDFLEPNDPLPISQFKVKTAFPKSGNHTVFVDFLVVTENDRKRHYATEGAILQQDFQVEFAEGSPSINSSDIFGDDNTQVKLQDTQRGYSWESPDIYTSPFSLQYGRENPMESITATLTLNNNETAVIARKCTQVSLKFTNATSGQPVTNLKAYLGMAAHLFVVHQDRKAPLHVHAMVVTDPTEPIDCSMEHNHGIMGSFGPFVGTSTTFPRAGWYKVYLQVNFNDTRIHVFSFNVFVEHNPDDFEGLPLVAEPVRIGEYSYNISLLSGRYKLFWNLEMNNTVLSAAIVTKGVGWAGIGFSPSDHGMGNCDMILGWIAGDGVTQQVIDTWSTEEDTPKLDTGYPGGEDNIMDKAVCIVNNEQTFKFRRRLNTNTPNDAVITNDTIEVVFAFNAKSNNLLDTHGTQDRGAARINFFTGNSAGSKSNKDLLRDLHAIFMVVSWLFLIPLGIFIARYAHSFKIWFSAHIVVMTFGIAMMAVAFILGIQAASNDFVQSDKLILSHSWIGLFVVILGGLLQPLLGWLADFWWDPERKATPVFPDRIHWYAGRFAGVGALVNIILGMVYYDSKRVWWILFGIWLFILIVLFVVFEKRRRDAKPPKKNLQELQEVSSSSNLMPSDSGSK